MSAAQRTVAVTGATGFLGRHTVAALAAAGWRVRILARSQPAHELWRNIQPEIVLGALDDPPALNRLVTGVDAVLHLAGLIKARDDAEFMRVNRDGTRALAEATRLSAPGAHFVQVSSLAAREPELSGYAASKRAAEQSVFEILDSRTLSVIRPPAIYGPGDRETLVFFQLASGRIVPVPGRAEARLTLIHVEEAATALVARLALSPSGGVQAIADAVPQGYSWMQILNAAAAAVGNVRPRFVELPSSLLRGAGHLAGMLGRLSGRPGMVNAGKVRELLHDDWSVPASELFRGEAPRRTLSQGFEATVAWYRQAGWLPSRT